MKVKQQDWRQIIVRAGLRFLFWWRYKIHVSGAEHIPETGGVLLLGNHLSYLDWALLQITCPRPVKFVLSRNIYHGWHLDKLFKLFRVDHYVIPISQKASKEAINLIRERLMAGEVVLLFPEGKVSRNGQVGNFQKGFEKVIVDTSAVIVPVYLLGVWGSLGSFATKISRRLQKLNGYPINVCFGTPLAADTSSEMLKQAIFRLSIIAWQEFPACQHTIAWQWLLAAKKMPLKMAVADATGVALSSLRLLVAVRFFRRQFMSALQDQSTVAVILPLSAIGIIVNLSLFVLGKIVINLNYTAGKAALRHAITSSNIKTIITSKQFVQRLQERGFDMQALFSMVNIIYVEDIRQFSNKLQLFTDMIYCKLLPFSWLAKTMQMSNCADDTAAILFSSGSEGKPKGVELTQQNIVSNVMQIIHVVNLRPQDVLLSTLPLFHSFGLTVNMLTPLFAGVPVICQPDPTDGVMVGKLVYKYQATILTGTATFLNFYCRQRKLHPLMLQSLRLIIAGAEKVNSRLREAFKLRFGLTIYEGYGATETSPVASTCLPDMLDVNDWHITIANKEGSVGLPLPGSAFRIVEPETMRDLPCKQAGLILIGGPQVKRGYWQDASHTNEVIVQDGNIRWYKTGDKGFLDEDGFLYIVDRYSRFAKIAGEMISLTAVEDAILSVLAEDEAEVLALAVPDDKKGEIIILFYKATLEETALQQLLARSDMDNIMLPGKVFKLQELPKLGSGKNDYQQAKQMAMKLMGFSLIE